MYRSGFGWIKGETQAKGLNKLTSGSISTFLPAAISNAYTFISAVTAYAFKKQAKNYHHFKRI